jgi:hypothetical protein
MDQFAFGSFTEFAQMVLDEKIPSSGMFWDLFSALVSMRPKGMSGKERADEQYSSERIKTTILENNLLASMSHARPACLYAKGGIGMLVGIEEGFGACESHAHWIAGVESMKKLLGKQLKDFASGVLGNMGTSGGGNDLAKALLAEIKVQWYEFVGWVDEFYKQLTEEANFKAKPAWRLVGRCASAIFDAMAEPRSKVAMLDDPTPLENKARIIWCVLQCHTVMRSFIDVRFQGHPVIVKEITMFMVTERVDPAELDNMRSRLIDTEATMKDTKAALKRVEENYNSLKRSLDNMMNEFRPIKAKVVAAKL